MKLDIDQINFDERGLIPAIVQNSRTREVLTLAYMNLDSLERTLNTKESWFWSRSRQKLWHKGETSGNTQRVVSMTLDCDTDALVVMVEPAGAACHTGAQSCFFNQILASDDPAENVTCESTAVSCVLEDLYHLIETRKRERPEGSYTTYLFNQGLDKILKKIGEESTETIIAAKEQSNASLINETADLVYHLLVLLVERGIGLEQVASELINRKSKTGSK
jgi:phosphoribosyl-AMP cyclohydrolase / phosphoribosyl-ATP pyrophosphohydrolase